MGACCVGGRRPVGRGRSIGAIRTPYERDRLLMGPDDVPEDQDSDERSAPRLRKRNSRSSCTLFPDPEVSYARERRPSNCCGARAGVGQRGNRSASEPASRRGRGGDGNRSKTMSKTVTFASDISSEDDNFLDPFDDAKRRKNSVGLNDIVVEENEAVSKKREARRSLRLSRHGFRQSARASISLAVPLDDFSSKPQDDDDSSSEDDVDIKLADAKTKSAGAKKIKAADASDTKAEVSADPLSEPMPEPEAATSPSPRGSEPEPASSPSPRKPEPKEASTASPRKE